MTSPNPISQAIATVGLSKLARQCGVTYQALRKWERNGFLPRTEWTGETKYAETIAEATDGAVSSAALLSVRPSARRAAQTEQAAA